MSQRLPFKPETPGQAEWLETLNEAQDASEELSESLKELAEFDFDRE